MINTVFRLIVLVPAALLCAFASFVTLNSGGVGFLPFLFWAAITAVAVALIAWTIFDHRRRVRSNHEVNA